MANDKGERKKTLVKKLAVAIILVILAILGVDIENIIPNETNETQNVQTEVETDVQESGEVLELHMIDQTTPNMIQGLKGIFARKPLISIGI